MICKIFMIFFLLQFSFRNVSSQENCLHLLITPDVKLHQTHGIDVFRRVPLNLIISQIIPNIKRDTLKHTPNCLDAQIILAGKQLQIIEKLLEVAKPFIQADKDRVIFIADDLETLQTSFQSCFARKLKFKVGIVREYGNENLQRFYGGCSFCGERQDSTRMFELQDQSEMWKDHQRNMEGSTLRIISPVNARPRLNYTLDDQGQYKLVNGLLMYAVMYLKQRLNFTLSFRPVGRGGGTGVKLPNGTWIGIMGEVLDGEADLGMCTAPTYSRSLVAGFSPAVVYESIAFVSGPPQRIFAWKAIFWPFQKQTWAFLSCLIMVSVILMSVSVKVFKLKGWKDSRILEYFVGILVEEVGSSPPRSMQLPIGVKIYIALWLLCGSVITTAYLSKLVGFLTFPLVDEIPETPEELVKSKFSWGLTYFGGAAYSIIKASKTQTYEKVLRKMELTTDHTGCLLRTLNSRFICLSYESVVKFFVNNDVEYLPAHHPLQVRSYLLSLPVGMVMEKRAVFSPNLDDAVQRFTSAGLIPEWEQMDFRILRTQRMTSMLGRVTKYGDDDQGLLTMKHLNGAFFLLAFGILIGTIGFILESFVRWRKRGLRMVSMQIVRTLRIIDSFKNAGVWNNESRY